jgi:signal transduction histidine kinase
MQRAMMVKQQGGHGLYLRLSLDSPCTGRLVGPGGPPRGESHSGVKPMRQIKLGHSIGTRIFGAFVSMVLFIGALGFYSQQLLNRAGELVGEIYDRPLMAINYARAASLDFALMQNGALREKLAAASEAPGIEHEIAGLAQTFFADLKAAEERMTAPQEQAAIKQITSLVRQWMANRKAEPLAGKPPGLDEKILARFDALIELDAGHSLVGRRKAHSAIAGYVYALGAATLGALLLALGVTANLVRHIVRPLSIAAGVADRIAGGEFETPIPANGRDEIGVLLRSMRVMQENIRATVRREQALRESAEMHLTGAIENSSNGVVLVGADGRILLANRRAGNLTAGLAPAMKPGASFADTLGIIEYASRRDADTGPLAGLLARSGEPGSTRSAERRMVNGRWLEFVASPAEDGGTIVFIGDITMQKEREESLRAAKNAAEAANAAKSRFLANMSHELRTPLNAIIGFSEIVVGQPFGPVGNLRYLDYASDILRSGRNLLEVINNVLELARSETGSMQLNGEPLDLMPMLADCASLIRSQCEAAGLAFSLSLPAEPLPVIGERAKLRQIFLHLLSNAVKFTESGTVGLKAEMSGDAIVITISDTGIGMSAEDIEVALTPFGQVDGRLARKYEGAGLGLPLAKVFVELHGGRIAIHSTPHCGTTVTVHFRSAGAEQRQIAASA